MGWTRTLLLAIALFVWLAPQRLACADDLSSASYRTTLVTSAGSGSTVDATNATIDSANYRNLFVAAQPTSTTNQQHVSASYRDSLGRIYLVWGLGTRYTEWMGTSAAVETNTAWTNAFNWGFGVPSAARDVLVPAALGYPVMGASATALSLTLSNTLTAVPNPSVSNSAAWNLTVSGDVTIGANTALDWTGSTGTIDLTGNWANSGTFTAGSSKVSLSGSTAATLTSAGNQAFYDLTVLKRNGATNNEVRVTTTSNFTVLHDLVNGDSGGLDYEDDFQATAGTITLSGTSDGKIWEYDTGSIRFWNLTIAKTNATVTTNKSLRVDVTLTVDAAAGWAHLVVGGVTSQILRSDGVTPVPETSLTVAADGILTVGAGVAADLYDQGADVGDANGDWEAGIINHIYNGQTSVGGQVQGFPVSAVDLSTGAFYAIYVTARDVDTSGTDRVYVLDGNGTLSYSWPLPAGNGDIVGRARYYTESGAHTCYVGTTTGRVYKLVDNGAALVDAGGPWPGNPQVVGSEVTSSIQATAIGATNYLVFGAKTGGGTPGLMVRQMTDGASLFGAGIAQTATYRVESDPVMTTISAVKYSWIGGRDPADASDGNVYRVKLQAAESAPEGTHAATEGTGNSGVVAWTTVQGGYAITGDTTGYVHRLENIVPFPGADTWNTPLNLGAADGVRVGAWPMSAGTYPQRVYLATEGGRVFAANTTTGSAGTLLGDTGPTGFDPDAGSAAALRVMPLARTDGTTIWVYVGSQDGKVMAIRESELLTAGGGATVATANFGNWAGNGITTVSVVSTTPARLMVGTTQGTVYLLPLVPTGW